MTRPAEDWAAASPVRSMVPSAVCLTYAALTATLLVSLAGTLSVEHALSYLGVGLLVFVGIPWVLAAAIALVVAVLLLTLAPFAVLATVRRCPSGFASLVEEALAIPREAVLRRMRYRQRCREFGHGILCTRLDQHGHATTE